MIWRERGQTTGMLTSVIRHEDARACFLLIESGAIHNSLRYDSRLGLERRPARMARAYSLDLRERVVAAVAKGQTCRAVAGTFGVSVASVVKWSQRFRATGSGQTGGRTPSLCAGRPAQLGAGKDRRSARPDPAGFGSRSWLTVGSWSVTMRSGTSWCGQGSRSKKPARQRAGSARRGQAARAGSATKAGLIPRVLSSSTRPGLRPTDANSNCSSCRPTVRTSTLSSKPVRTSRR
jgi:transposase-like protein